jgi:hypothetical protein
LPPRPRWGSGALNRLDDPVSQHARNDRGQDAGFLPEAEGRDVHRLYRAMDVVHENWNELEKRTKARIPASLSGRSEPPVAEGARAGSGLASTARPSQLTVEHP